MLPFWLVEVVFWALIAANAVLAYGLRDRALFCVASLAFLPFVPALFRYLVADQSVVLPIGAESVRIFVIFLMSFLPVWVGFAGGLLFNWLNSGIPPSASKIVEHVGQPTPENWRNVLSQNPDDVKSP